ncbi:Ras family protein [Dictyocaulus viviparus]|uniref:Ras family protein n=2 Tax=Dictyocaulus viviparus TaxID=29172 RepID=A0A0D8Y3V5_DICVI|nr:Ras family protein [Dictyocaulus viviparus]
MTRNERKLGRSKSAIRARAPNVSTREVGRRPYEITVVVLGATKVGKSALVSQYLWESFLTEYRPTVEEFNWVEYEIGDGSSLMLQIIDSSGSHDFLAMHHFYIKTGDAFMVVFSIDDASSLEEAKRIIEEIDEERHKTVPVVLVANKCDLNDDVMKWEAKGSHQYAYSRTIPIIECSAKRHSEVIEAFKELLERLRDKNRIGIAEMTKRRQSMPSTRAYSGIDVADMDRLKNKHKTNCVIC